MFPKWANLCRCTSFNHVCIEANVSKLCAEIKLNFNPISPTDEVTRDYIEPGVTDLLVRKAKLLPWQPEDLTHLSYEQHEEDESFFRVSG